MSGRRSGVELLAGPGVPAVLARRRGGLVAGEEEVGVALVGWPWVGKRLCELAWPYGSSLVGRQAW